MKRRTLITARRIPRKALIPVTAVLAAAVASCIVFAVAGGAGASTAAGRHACVAGLYDEHATQLKGPEKGLKEHFQVLFAPDGFFYQVSGTAGDATAIGTWTQEGSRIRAVFDALNQDPAQPYDYFRVVLAGTVNRDASRFTVFGYATGYNRHGHVILRGQALNTGVRLAAAAHAPPGCGG